MQSVTNEFDTNSKKIIRKPTGKFEVDWDLDGDYDDESANVIRLEGERTINEPLGGIHSAQFDVLLNNISKRYSPASDSAIADYLKINRRANMYLGFEGENIYIGRGVSEVPVIDEAKRTAKIHFFDELEVISDFKLSEGSDLYLDVRTDLYIWDILDEVYEDFFTDLATFDTGETWVGGTLDTVNMRGGDKAMMLESVDASYENSYRDVTLDLSTWDLDDNISFFVYIEDVSKVDILSVRLHSVADDTFADLDVTQYPLVNGWNQIVAPLEDFVSSDISNPPSTWFQIGVSEIGEGVIPAGSFDWDTVVRVEVILQATSEISYLDNYSIYDDDAIATDWHDWSWDSTRSFNDTDPHEGTTNILLTLTAPYAALYLRYPDTLDTTDYTALRVAVKATTTGQRVQIGIFGNVDLLGAVEMGAYGGDPTTAGYKVYTIPLADLNAEATDIYGIMVQEISGATGTSLKIDSIELLGAEDTTTAQDVYAIFDEIRVTDKDRYPKRNFDVGLQNIPVASFSGNTAGFEIKTASESEGARFFSDEEGVLHFQNRQHFNNQSLQSSVMDFDFTRILEFSHPNSEQDVINSVNVRLSPRKIVAEKVIWTFGYNPQIGAGETLEVWASFSDPVPTTTTGLVTPVATTDYTANDAVDGSGSSRTSDVSIAITKFTTSAKLLITNTGGSPLYVTLLQLRGTPAEVVNELLIKLKDQTSIDTYGERPSGGMDIDSKYLSDITYAQTLGQQIIDWYKDPIDRVKIKVFAMPHLQIGDMITVTNGYTGVTFLMRITGTSFQFSNGSGMIQEIDARAVSPFELLTFFEIGTSSIGGTDIIGV